MWETDLLIRGSYTVITIMKDSVVVGSINLLSDDESIAKIEQAIKGMNDVALPS